MLLRLREEILVAGDEVGLDGLRRRVADPHLLQLLLATRDGKTRARLLALAALGAIVDALEEEYLALLPEAIPFLSELFEDPDERVEAAARKLTARLTELSGEDLKSLMSEGGGR